MAGADVNSVVLVGRLTRDPELRSTGSGMSVCSLRLAFSTRAKEASGEWTTRPNYVDVTVWGKQGENVARFMSKGRQVAVQGRLQWREWTTNDGGKRQALDVVAESVQFLSDGQGAGGESGGSGFAARSDVPIDTADLPQQGADESDDIPF
jgi:single-strand DNA-binding protein